MRASREKTHERTFLYVDVVGSTLALRRLGLKYAMALETLRRVLERAARDRGGRLVDAVGDSMLFTFDRPDDAVIAALVGQGAIAVAPDELVVDVRMGIHSGPVGKRGREFIGLAVHKATRVAAFAQGGQILMSCEAVDGLEANLQNNLVFVRRSVPPLKDFEDDTVYELQPIPVAMHAASG